MKTSIVVPAYNEEHRIGTTLKELFSYFDKRNVPYEIIVVDDGSIDDTVNVASRFNRGNVRILINGRNRGKGYSVRRGVLETEGELILFSDADLSTPIEEYENLSGWVEKGYDMVVASRGLADSNISVRQAWWREGMGKIFNFLVRMTLNLDFRDTQCGFKVFKKEAAKKIFALQKLNGFAFDAEALYLAVKLGFSVREVPVAWKNSPESKVRPVRDSLSMLLSLIKIRLTDYSGK